MCHNIWDRCTINMEMPKIVDKEGRQTLNLDHYSTIQPNYNALVKGIDTLHHLHQSTVSNET